MTKPATGSSQAAPVTAYRPRATSVEMLSSTQILVWAASARMSRSPPRATATRRLARASTGMMTTESTSSTIPAVECSGGSPAAKDRMPSTVTYPARAKNVTATARRVRRSLASSATPSRSRADRRNATRTAVADSIPESSPKPTRDTSPASSPAATATTPSATLYATVNWDRRNARRVSASTSVASRPAGSVVPRAGTLMTIPPRRPCCWDRTLAHHRCTPEAVRPPPTGPRAPPHAAASTPWPAPGRARRPARSH